MINLQKLIDDAKCYETVRELRWPEGVCCPHCDSTGVSWQERTVPLQAAFAEFQYLLVNSAGAR